MTVAEARRMLAERWGCRESDLNILSVEETVLPATRMGLSTPEADSSRIVPRYPTQEA